MPLIPGTRLGVYDITARIGVGGMGEVYRATDSNLKRSVAIKALPASVAGDADRLARFQREAEVLAALNHTNIAAIYGLEKTADFTALVMELVEGEDLSQRISRGPISIDEALPIAKQIADALEAAHEQGIIHRDLKPANIKVRADGTVKVLDFGLAKAMEPSAGSSPSLSSPTITTPAMTKAGMILGTAAYMSPEQARGKAVDRRADIWAFGCVLYEMLSGRRAFEDEDTSDTIASVLKNEPDWSLVPADVPAPVVALAKGCLVKDARQRVSDMSTPKFILRELGASGAMPRTPIRPPTDTATAGPRWKNAIPVAIAAAMGSVIAGAGVWMLRPTPRPPDVARFSFTPEGPFTGTVHHIVAISPDGTRMAYNANGRIYVRALGELESRPVTDPETSALNPVFAPDGNSIAFVTAGLALRRVPFSGGTASTVATFEGTQISGLSWGRDGILMGVTAGGGILRVAPDGGSPQRIVTVASDEIVHAPRMLPGGRTVVFTLAKDAGDDRWERAKIVAQSLVDGSRRILIEGGSDARYVEPGHLLYAIGGTMYAVAFDPETLAVTGAAMPVVVGIRRATGGTNGSAQLAISETGTLVYVPGPATGFSGARGLEISDGHDNRAPLRVPPAVYAHPRVSPNGRVVAVGRAESGSSDIWTYDLSGKAEIQRLTFGGQSRFPVWSADSRRVTFQSAHDRAIWWQLVDGGAAERLTSPLESEAHVPESWSADGTRLLFSVRRGPVHALWVLTLVGLKAEPFGQVQSAESLSASFSPDGRWVAYASTERAGGTLSPNRGVFVEQFPPTGVKRQVPKRLLDYHPVWAPDGKSIFYVPGATRPLVSVPVTVQPSIAFGTPIEITRAPLPGLLSTDVRGYDVLADGRFVSVASASGEGPAGTLAEVRVVLNWTEELKRLLPTK